MLAITPEGTTSYALKDGDCVLALARCGAIGQVFYNDAVSFADPGEVPGWLVAFKSQPGTSLVMAVHDYFAICPSQFLLNDAQRFCRVPEMTECQRCLPANGNEFATLFVERDMPSWRSRWLAALDAADEIRCFSNSSRELLLRAYPGLCKAAISVVPHRLPPQIRRPQVNIGAPLHIGVVGAIGFHKGAGVIAGLADVISARGLPVKITVIGTLEAAYNPSVVHVTGRYEKDDLALLIERSSANVFLLPSICPETFSYVTQEMIDLKLPLVCFDFGAPAERVGTYARGKVLPLTDASLLLDSLIRFHADMRDVQQPTEL
ncbi:MAG: glycosyltransferase [Oxalobacteraceae bacterium]|nr:MAG: glycosyltransferase [Oxalobacteraceae bacterium]